MQKRVVAEYASMMRRRAACASGATPGRHGRDPESWVRATWKGDRWEIPEGASATLRLADPRGDIQLSTNLNVTANGSIQVSFDAPARPRG